MMTWIFQTAVWLLCLEASLHVSLISAQSPLGVLHHVNHLLDAISIPLSSPHFRELFWPGPRANHLL